MKKLEEEFNYLIELSGKVLTGQIEAEEFETHRTIFLNKYGKKQQPEIPEVSKEVANIYEKHKDQHHKLSVILEELYVNTFATFGSSLTQGEVDDIVVSMRTNGYTVAKEKRFYLKHKSVLIFDPDNDDSYVDELYLGAGGNFVPYQHLAKIFTQSQIDSMETGSYELIEVEGE